MTKIKSFLRNHWGSILLWLMIILYIGYFSVFTILRYRTLYSSYFDLGIMHQTVFNTYRSIRSLDPSRFLELTNPYGPQQIKRMAIHNDILLAFIALFYFIYSGPETLLILQTVVLAIGAWAVFKIGLIVLEKIRYKNVIALLFAFSYLVYSPMQRANIFEFHAVTLSTTFLLFMFYFWLKKRHGWSFIFFLLSILSKEQVALTTLFFGCYVLFRNLIQHKFKIKKIRQIIFPVTIIFASVFWFLFSMTIVIPYFRGTNHFALSYYADFGDSPFRIILGVLDNPRSIFKYIFHIDTLRYFFFLLGPLGFLSFFSPFQLLIAAPEFGINLLSNNWNMRNIVYHYTSVIQPFVFISAIYGIKHLLGLTSKMRFNMQQIRKEKLFAFLLSLIIVCSAIIFAYFKGPLPFSKEKDIHPFLYPQKEKTDAAFWQNLLKNKRLKVSSTGQMAPFFASRRYFYNFSQDYHLADYIVLRLTEIYNYPEKDTLIPVYEKLNKDKNYKMIYKNEDVEVYKKI